MNVFEWSVAVPVCLTVSVYVGVPAYGPLAIYSSYQPFASACCTTTGVRCKMFSVYVSVPSLMVAIVISYHVDSAVVAFAR